jgi:ParB-like chromosome segregation protein Spo0J
LGLKIPDEWWVFCGMPDWNPASEYFPYRSSEASVEIVELADIVPPARSERTPNFRKYKMVPILLAFQSPECFLPPIKIREILDAGGARFEVANGFHRYYASIAAGYSHIPAIVVPGDEV